MHEPRRDDREAATPRIASNDRVGRNAQRNPRRIHVQGVREEMGAAGRKYFMEHFEMQRQARRLLDILNERLA